MKYHAYNRVQHGEILERKKFIVRKSAKQYILHHVCAYTFGNDKIQTEYWIHWFATSNGGSKHFGRAIEVWKRSTFCFALVFMPLLIHILINQTEKAVCCCLVCFRSVVFCFLLFEKHVLCIEILYTQHFVLNGILTHWRNGKR